MKYLRLIALAIIFFSIILLPYWIYLLLLFVSIVLLPFFWEAIAFGFLIDVLYGGGVGEFSSIFYSTAFMALVLVLVFIPIQKRLRFHV